MQRNRITALWRQATLILAVSAALVVPAQAAPAPDEVVRNAVERMTQRIDNERERLKEDAAYARRVINEELDALVDFRRVTRLVMGDHFQNASAEQRREFMRRFRTSLVQTFSTGITLYEGQPIRVLP
ncbi:MAG: toluene tolerance protein, partial [Alcanivorax sp.]|nr:toluene tolerance protein [Alcanivorax sp.]